MIEGWVAPSPTPSRKAVAASSGTVSPIGNSA